MELFILKDCKYIIYINGFFKFEILVNLRRKVYENVMKKYGK